MKRFLSVMLLLILVIFTLSGCDDPAKVSDNQSIISDSGYGLKLHFIDVGQGDSTLVESSGRFALIDGGEYSERDKVVSYLSSQGVKELDYIISTHPHSDHCGGLSEVIRTFSTAVLICPDAPTSSSWEYVMDAADERGVTYETPNPYDTYQLGSATITVLSPDKNDVYSELNDYSIVTMIEYGNTSALLTGDAEKGVEKALVRSGYDLSADILKCGHHGSSTSSCEQFLDAVSPDAAVISCGKNNEYGHPHEETLTALKERNVSVWRTDNSGNVVALSDGENFTFSTSTEVATIAHNTQPETLYIGNKNSKVFHALSCGAVNNMKEDNKIPFENYDDAVNAGYRPCGTCDP